MNECDDSWTTLAEDESDRVRGAAAAARPAPDPADAAELVREMGGESRRASPSATRSSARSATSARVGLLHQQGEFVEPTRAALRFSELLDR